MTDHHPSAVAGWYPDPLQRYEFRYYNGQRWTTDVAVDGHRYVDPVDAAPGGPVRPSSTGPSRVRAIVSFVLAIGALSVAWMPFVFALGALAAIAAIVLAIVVLRRARAGRAAGRGFAVAAITIAVAALGLCSVGVILTGITVREFLDYTDPGPVDVELTACEPDGSRLHVAGTITDQDDEAHDYWITIDVREGARSVDLVRVEVRDVAPGEQREWSQRVFVDAGDLERVTCAVFDVSGPYPFGLSPA